MTQLLVDSWLARMDVATKAGQMTQLDMSLVVDDTACPVTLSASKLRDVLGRLRVGSLLNTPFSGANRCNSTGWSASEWRAIVAQVQEEAARQGLPPLVIGIDSIHGANYVRGATLFPQQLGLAAAFDTSLLRAGGFVTGKDTRAAGLHWIFSPVLGLGVNPLWSRLYETFGEDPKLVSSLGGAMIQGLQQIASVGADGTISPTEGGACTPSQFCRVAATMKHFIGCARAGLERTAGLQRSPVPKSSGLIAQPYAHVL